MWPRFFFKPYQLAQETKPGWKSLHSIFFSDSVGWVIVELTLTRTKAEFGWRI